MFLIIILGILSFKHLKIYEKEIRDTEGLQYEFFKDLS